MRRPTSALLCAPILLALILTGCGKSSSNPASSNDGTVGYTAPTGPAPVTQPPTAPGAPGAGTAAPVVAKLQAAWAAAHTVTGHYTFWEKSGSETETASVDMWLKKPGHYRLEVQDASEALKRGSKSVFDTTSRKIESRPGGPLSLVKLSGTLDDARSKSVRGYTLDQTDYATQVTMLIANAATLKLVAGHGPGPTLELPLPAKYPGIDALRATLDPTKNLPVYFEMVSKGLIVHTRKFTSLNVNASIGSDKFSI